ncbi:MAG TPA: hypothetical protein VFN10_19965 [Thermoanaerobaculia bacterium]|nr:hypothetical protein [Thermoanaerobaculia bacterium]
MTLLDSPERRRYGRIRLDRPLNARFGEFRVQIVELSVSGFLVLHEARFAANSTNELTAEWDGRLMRLICTTARSTLVRLAKTAAERSLYESGLNINESIGDSYEVLRELIADRILRALDEQKANARGIPPLMAYMYQPEKGDLYRRCEWIDGRWRKSETVRPSQPPNGFTISAEVEATHVDLLCRTWERTTGEGRRLTQLLAELSISPREGVPVRRYVP